MHLLSGILLASGLQLVRAHGGHSDGERIAGETIQQYAQRHVSVRAPVVGLTGFLRGVLDVYRAPYVCYFSNKAMICGN